MAPELLIVVDTEEEFDWSKPFSRESTSTASIPAQARAHEIYDRFGVVPTYVVDYPVAADPAAAGFLRALKEAGKAEIGAHLHPWVTPPHVEEVTALNSYHCNLPPELERAKIVALTEAIHASFGERPTIFKAGRYGFGANTGRVLAELGYRIDCSKLPYTDLGPDGGPDFRGTPADPHWLAEGLLEVPLTVGFFGAAPALGPRVEWLFDSPGAARLRLPGLLARTGLVARSRLTPEGVPAAEQCRLLEALVRRGQRVFTLAYHSPSLAPGNTPYVRDEAELAAFLASIEQVLSFFREDLGGRFTTLSRLHREYSATRRAA
ncbi:MAG TPA: polysaccharide deacetylase family protein [Allosphingosinicella sp.]|nr:polysaccharide deacetylase family protein [Allosphingosinicella sp.]